ncbi:MAG: nickel/cobalt transporter [Alphaproteobacteria bacterium]
MPLKAGVAVALLLAACGTALAQGAHPFGMPGAPAAAPDPGLLDALLAWVRAEQSVYWRQLSGAVRAAGETHAAAATATLVALSFVYGVLHAVGPGHGKAVVTAYVLTNERVLRRGLLVAALAALLQALVAIVLTLGALALITGATRAVEGGARALELASYALVMAVGAVFAWRGGRRLFARAGAEHHHHHATHDHAPDDHTGHDHAHHIAPAAAVATADWRMLAGLVVAMGARPCSGAILVLVFAWSAGLVWAGVVSALAMGAGTGLAVAVVATLAHAARLPARWVGLRVGFDLARAGAVAATLGGLAILLLGALLLAASLATPPALVPGG